MSNFIYSQTCIKRSSLGQGRNGLGDILAQEAA